MNIVDRLRAMSAVIREGDEASWNDLQKDLERRRAQERERETQEQNRRPVKGRRGRRKKAGYDTEHISQVLPRVPIVKKLGIRVKTQPKKD